MTSRRNSAGFTLMEVLVAIAVVAILIGMLIVGIRVGAAAAKRRVIEQNVAGLKFGVDSFVMDYGFLPPLVNDDMPLTGGGRKVVNVFEPTNPAHLEFFRGNPGPVWPGDRRYSDYSLAYYVMGSLSEDIDGLDPGYREPRADGTFHFGGKASGPRFDPGRNGRVSVIDAAEGRIELQDGNGVAYRYYRWEHGDPNGPTYPPQIVNVPDDWNIPELVQGDRNPTSDPQLKSAQYAIVAAGANGVFGDFANGSETPAEVSTKLGMASGTPEQDLLVQQRARSDNVVAVGRK